MTGVQVFLMAFGALLALIGVVVFFLLAWFKETTGQDHHNAIKILQAEFRFSNPSLVIFAGGLLLMVAPFFLGNNSQGVPTPVANPESAPATIPELAAPALGATPTSTPVSASLASTQADTPVPPTTPTATDTPVPPTPTPTATPTPPIFTAPDPTGRWRNQTGFLEFRRLGTDEFAYSDFDSFGNPVGRGTATQDEDILYISGEESGVDGFGNPYYLAYTGEFTLDGDVLTGDLYETLSGSFIGSVLFTRDPAGLGQ